MAAIVVLLWLHAVKSGDRQTRLQSSFAEGAAKSAEAALRASDAAHKAAESVRAASDATQKLADIMHLMIVEQGKDAD